MKALGLSSCSLAGFIEEDDIGEGIGGWWLGGMIGGTGGSGVGEWKVDRRDKWG